MNTRACGIAPRVPDMSTDLSEISLLYERLPVGPCVETVMTYCQLTGAQCVAALGCSIGVSYTTIVSLVSCCELF